MGGEEVEKFCPRKRLIEVSRFFCFLESFFQNTLARKYLKSVFCPASSGGKEEIQRGVNEALAAMDKVMTQDKSWSTFRSVPWVSRKVFNFLAALFTFFARASQGFVSIQLMSLCWAKQLKKLNASGCFQADCEYYDGKWEEEICNYFWVSRTSWACSRRMKLFLSKNDKNLSHYDGKKVIKKRSLSRRQKQSNSIKTFFGEDAMAVTAQSVKLSKEIFVPEANHFLSTSTLYFMTCIVCSMPHA